MDQASKINGFLRVTFKDEIISKDVSLVLKKIPMKIEEVEIEGLPIPKGQYPDLDYLKEAYVSKVTFSFPEIPGAKRMVSFGHMKTSGVKALLEKREEKGLTLYDFSGSQMLKYGSYASIGTKEFYEGIGRALEGIPSLKGIPVSVARWTGVEANSARKMQK